MKHAIIAVLAATFALGLSSGVRAASCSNIAKSVVSTFADSYELPKGSAGYLALIGNQRKSCEMGVQLRAAGKTPQEIAATAGKTYELGSDRLNTDEALLGFAMANMSISAGYAYGE